MKRCVIFALIIAVPEILPAQAPQGSTRPPVITPVFDAKNFPASTTINNRYFPMIPGTTFLYEATRGPPEHNEFVVTRDTKKILKVDCVVVHDTASVAGEVVEDTFDFFAQDKDGNVWCIGKIPNSLRMECWWEPWVRGRCEWRHAGFHNGRTATLVGDAYRQENSPGVAEDNAQVVSLTGSVSVPYGSWQGNVLVTNEWSPLEPKVTEEKYYALDVGLVRATTIKGGTGESVLSGHHAAVAF